MIKSYIHEKAVHVGSQERWSHQVRQTCKNKQTKKSHSFIKSDTLDNPHWLLWTIQSFGADKRWQFYLHKFMITRTGPTEHLKNVMNLSNQMMLKSWGENDPDKSFSAFNKK